VAFNGGSPAAKRIEGEDYIHKAETRDSASQIRILQEEPQYRVLVEIVVHFPEFGPGQQDEREAYFEPKQQKYDAEDPVHHQA
jgi:hypothetical protein